MQPSVRTRRGASRPADASASEALRGTSQAGGRHAGGRGGSDLAAGSARPVRPYWRQWPAWVGYAAAIWSAVYGALGVYWATGGAGFPFGVGHDPSAHLSVLAGARPAIAAPAIALLGLLGVVVGVTIARASGRGPERVALLVLAWAFAAGLALVIPDARVLALAAYAPLLVIGPLFGWSPSVRFVDAMSWPLVNQTVCVSGGLLWAAAATVYQRRTNRACPHCGRADRSASWTRPQAAARWGRWAVVIAAVVPPLYAVSRLAWALGIPLGISNAMLRAGQAEGNGVLGAPFGLACVAIGGAVLTLGLTRPWGEVFPRWLPVLGGKRVPPALAIVPAALVSTLVLAAGLAIARMWLAGAFVVEAESWGGSVPMLLWPLWGVALAAATLAYYYRRRGRCEHCGRA